MRRDGSLAKSDGRVTVQSTAALSLEPVIMENILVTSTGEFPIRFSGKLSIGAIR